MKNSRLQAWNDILAVTLMATSLASTYFCLSQSRLAQQREQRIVQFYQKNGVCPNDATPAYLDLRTQLWQRDVEQQ
jgi:hypothetical protein